jgi:hypothetical protein
LDILATFCTHYKALHGPFLGKSEMSKALSAGRDHCSIVILFKQSKQAQLPEMKITRFQVMDCVVQRFL